MEVVQIGAYLAIIENAKGTEVWTLSAPRY